MFLNNFKNFIAKKKRKNMQEEISYDQLVAQALFESFTKQIKINGLTFIERRLLIRYVPEMIKIAMIHEDLFERINEYIQTLQESTNLVSIGKEEITSCKECYAAKVFTYLNSKVPPAYLVQGVIFLHKREDGKWIILKKEEYGYKKEEIKTFDEYPESLEISYCGCFGDVNYITEDDFTYSKEIFFKVNKESSEKFIVWLPFKLES